MPKESISFRIESERQTDINEIHWQCELISKRLTVADSGKEGVEHSEVFSKLRQRLKAELIEKGVGAL